jgi:hypothetical protein
MPKVDFHEEVANVALAELLARNNIRLARYSGTIARTVHESDLRTIRVSCAKDYSYLNAAIGSTRMADELLKPLILLTNWSEAA